jgi:hypothetical protein
MNPKKALMLVAITVISITLIDACKKGDAASPASSPATTTTPTTMSTTASAVETAFGTNITLSSLENYAAQVVPPYITKDNCGPNPVTNAGATLGRGAVL